MRRHRTLATMMLGTAAILTCILAPVSGIAAEPSVNKQLAQAAKNGDPEQVKTLLAQGADVNVEVDGRAVLMWAVDPRNRMRAWPMLKESYKKAYLRSVNLDIVKFLVDQGADVNAGDKDGRTALMCVVLTGDLAIVKYLVDKGADVNARGVSRYCGRHMWGPGWAPQDTPLASAAESENMEIMEFLVDKGADMNVKDECGCTALIRAAQRGHPDVATFLINKGADVNAKDKSGRTALMESAEQGILEVVRFLIDKGADVNAEDKIGRTALDFAHRSGGPHHSKTFEYLKAHGAK